MRWIIFGMLVVICLLLLICYALCVMAHDADERAERMYRAWKEGLNDKNRDDERPCL